MFHRHALLASHSATKPWRAVKAWCADTRRAVAALSAIFHDDDGVLARRVAEAAPRAGGSRRRSTRSAAIPNGRASLRRSRRLIRQSAAQEQSRRCAYRVLFSAHGLPKRIDRQGRSLSMAGGADALAAIVDALGR